MDLPGLSPMGRLWVMIYKELDNLCQRSWHLGVKQRFSPHLVMSGRPPQAFVASTHHEKYPDSPRSCMSRENMFPFAKQDADALQVF